MKSERLVWTIQEVDYIETVVRRERHGTSHAPTISDFNDALKDNGTLDIPTWRQKSRTCPKAFWNPWTWTPTGPRSRRPSR